MKTSTPPTDSLEDIISSIRASKKTNSKVRFDEDIYGHDVEMYQKFGLK